MHGESSVAAALRQILKPSTCFIRTDSGFRRWLGTAELYPSRHGVIDAPRSCQQTLYNLVVHFAYIVRCSDGTLYTGYARDPHARAKVHNSGRGARYTSGRRPVRLVYTEMFESLSAALKREYQLKRLSRTRKEALIAARSRRRRPRKSIVKSDGPDGRQNSRESSAIPARAALRVGGERP